MQFGFDKYEINLSTRPEKAVGDDDIWEKATSALRDALDDKGWTYQIDEGGGAFYGPKIDLKIEDALGRKWQCSTIQASPDLKISIILLLKEYYGSFNFTCSALSVLSCTISIFYGIWGSLSSELSCQLA